MRNIRSLPVVLVLASAIALSLAGCSGSESVAQGPGSAAGAPAEWPSDIPLPEGEIVDAPLHKVTCFQPEGTNWVCSLNVSGGDAELADYQAALVAAGFDEQRADPYPYYTRGTQSVNPSVGDGFVKVDATFDK
jgi:hypothetical protein